MFGNQPAQQRLGGPDDQLTVVGDHDVIPALVVGPVVAEVVGDQGGREPGPITIRSHSRRSGSSAARSAPGRRVTGMPWPRAPVSAARVARNSYRLWVAG